MPCLSRLRFLLEYEEPNSCMSLRYGWHGEMQEGAVDPPFLPWCGMDFHDFLGRKYRRTIKFAQFQ